MIYNWDKVLTGCDPSRENEAMVIVRHDVTNHKKVFYKLVEMDMDEILQTLNSGNGRLVAGNYQENTKAIEEIDGTKD